MKRRLVIDLEVGEADDRECGMGCDHGSPCILPAPHVPADRHETAHGCVFYDARNRSVCPDGCGNDCCIPERGEDDTECDAG